MSSSSCSLFPTAALPADSPLLDTFVVDGDGGEHGRSSKKGDHHQGKLLHDRPVVFHSHIRSSGYGKPAHQHHLNNRQQQRQRQASTKGASLPPLAAFLLKSYPTDTGPCVRHLPRLDIVPGSSSPAPLLDLAFTPAGVLLTAGADGVVDAYPLATKRGSISGSSSNSSNSNRTTTPLTPKTFVPSSLSSSPMPLRQVRSSHSGLLFLTASDDGRARMWSLDEPRAPILTICPSDDKAALRSSSIGVAGAATASAATAAEASAIPSSTTTLPPVVGASPFWLDQFVLVASGRTLGQYAYRLERLARECLIRHHPVATHPGQSRCVHRWVHTHAQSITAFDAISTGALSPMVITAASDRSLALLDAATGSFVRIVPDAHDRPVHTVRLAQLCGGATAVTRGHLETFATAATDGVVTLWDVRRKVGAVVSLQGAHVNRREKVGLAFSPCMRWLAVGSEDRAAYVYDVRSVSRGPLAVHATTVLHADGTERPVHADVVSAVAWHPVLPQLVTGGFDGSVRTWGPED